MKDIEVLEKDPMITSLILAVLSLKTDLTALQTAIEQIKVLLGENANSILNSYQCPSYFADLESAVGFIEIELKQMQKSA